MTTSTPYALLYTVVSVTLVAVSVLVVAWMTFFARGATIIEFKLDIQSPNEETHRKAKQPVIYFASESGNAESYAKNIVNAIKDTIGNVPVMNLADFDPNDFIVRRIAIFVVSTFGDGESAENARSFDNFLCKAAKSSQFSLSHMKIAVFGLGDSSYTQYNAMAKRTRENLLLLGATEFIDLGLGDASKDSKQMFLTWMNSHLIPRLPSVIADIRRRMGFASQMSQIGGQDEAPLELVFASSEKEILPLSNGSIGLPSGLKGYDMTTRFFFDGSQGSIDEIHEIRVKANEAVHETTKHVSISLPPALRGKYVTAGTMDVLPLNDTAAVDAMISILSPLLPDGVDDNSFIAFKNVQNTETMYLPPAPHPFPSPLSIRDALTRYLDLSAAPDADILSQFEPFLANPSEAANVRLLVSRPQIYSKLISEPELSFVEVHQIFLSSLKIPFVDFLRISPKMKVRSYSISSTPILNPSEVHLTITKDTKIPNTPFNLSKFISDLAANGIFASPSQIPSSLLSPSRLLKGVASSFLTSASSLHTNVLFRVKDSAFRIPADSTSPIILLAAGSGLAPIRAIMAELSVRKGNKKNPVVLFFGCRRPDEDMLCEPEIKRYLLDGTLKAFYPAFSRVEGQRKTYVQDRILQEAEELKAFMQMDNEQIKKRYIMVCGAPEMANAAEDSLRDVLGNNNIEGLKKNGCFQVEFF